MPHLPPIAALRALAVAARHLSFTKAADELNVTQSAVSHQIRHIEELWDVQLFERRPRKLLLTPAGEQLSKIVNGFIDELGLTLESLKADEGHTALRIEMLPSLAVKWLVPRLQDFRNEHPEVDVWLSTRQDNRPGLDRGDLDAAITLGDGNYPGLSSWELMRDYVIPVARPRFLEEYGMPKTPEDLCRLPLLLRQSSILSPGWDFWFDYAGVAPEVYQPALRDGTRFPDPTWPFRRPSKVRALPWRGVHMSGTIWRPGGWSDCSISTVRRMYWCISFAVRSSSSGRRWWRSATG